MTIREIVGWVFRAYEDEDLWPHLKEGTVYLWKGAHSTGKELGQPVLFVQSTSRASYWLGRGHVVGTEERWRKYGVRVACDQRLPERLPIVDRPARNDVPNDPGTLATATDPIAWENRAMAIALGIPVAMRRRAPDHVYVRDFGLTGGDLDLLLSVQPKLASLWRPSA